MNTDYNNIKKELLSLQTVLNEIVMIENRLTERIKDLNNNLDLLSMSCGIAGLDCSLVPPRISLNISENDVRAKHNILSTLDLVHPMAFKP